MPEILAKLDQNRLLFMLDAGLYAMDILWLIDQKQHKFIVKASRKAKFKPIKTFAYGSFLPRISYKILYLDAILSKSGRQRCKKLYLA